MGQFDFEKAAVQHMYGNNFSEFNLYTDNVKTGRFQSRKFIIIGGLVAVLALALILGLALGLKKSSDDDEPSVSEQKGTGATVTTTQATIVPTVVPLTSTSSSRPTTPSPKSWISQPCSAQRPKQQCPWSSPPLLLVSLDGFRAEYLLRNYTPVIEKLRTCGVHTPYMRAAYPTLTFPNHYTIVTGLYPVSHGIVGNSFYDPVNNATCSGKSRTNPIFYKGEPLWNTARHFDKKSASYFWVGSEVNISGGQPDRWFKYDGKIPFEERVDTVLGWLQEPNDTRPDFITLYFNEPDHTGHGNGPDSPQVNKMLKRMDSIIGRLMDGLLRQNMDHCVNLIVLADHGMESTSCDRQVNLNPYLNNLDDYLIYSGTVGHINPKYKRKSSRSNLVTENSPADSAESISNSLQCKNPHLNVYTEDTIPVRHHYTNSLRVGSVVLDVETSWLVYPKPSKSCLKGNHGYDNIYKSMHALFLAHGPGFKDNYKAEPFENIELYNLMSGLLEITPAPNNGTAGSLHHMLRNPPTLKEPSKTEYQTTKNQSTRNHSSCECSNVNTTLFVTNPPEDQTPFGIPSIESNTSMYLLPSSQFVSVYSDIYKMPAWTSYTLTKKQVINYTEPSSDCVVMDTRLSEEDNPTCSIDRHFLFNLGYTTSDTELIMARLSSNIVPMRSGFKTGVWQFLTQLIREYTVKHERLSITTGPIFDYNFDGLADTDTDIAITTSGIPVPTHYYMIITKCADVFAPLSDCHLEDITTMSLILPHKNNTSNCQTYKQFLHTNVARIRDIELLTGLRFMTKFPLADGARLKTYLATTLWEAPSLTDWKELPCASADTNSCPYTSSLPLLLISLDGFRAEYLMRGLTPTIQRLANCGVHTPYMRAVYPTVTFPNHYTIVTGLYPESHGIIANSMYDKEIGEAFSLSAAAAKDPRWWKGEPLWNTAKKQGLKTATYFWPGSDVNISGMYPDFWKKYDGKAGYVERIDTVLSWLTLPEDSRPDFLTLYFDQPDHAGHEKGPESELVNSTLQTMDELIDILMTKLYERNLHNCLNMVIIADHGFAPQSCSQAVFLDKYAAELNNSLVFGGVMGNVMTGFTSDKRHNIYTRNDTLVPDQIVRELKCRHPTMKAFTKSTIPRRHHYTNTDRIGEVLIDMKESWLVFRDKLGFCTGGNHGWDNINKHMHALFLAHGPAFKENFTVDPFENIELYNMMCDVLNITAAHNNGTSGSLNSILRSPKPISPTSGKNYDNCNLALPQNLNDCYCSPSKSISPTSLSLNMNGNLSVFGEPQLTSKESVCKLHQPWFSTGYSITMRSPVWVSTVLTGNELAVSWTMNGTCVLEDGRTTFSCPAMSNTNISLTPLITLGDSNGDKFGLSSASVPMYTGFRNEIWQTVLQLLDDYSSQFRKVSVTMGTIFDYNNDGKWEGKINKTKYVDNARKTPIPTHLYLIIVKCKDSTNQLPCGGHVDILSFILPHLQEQPNCLPINMYLRDNVARIVDIELLTGLKFMNNLELDVGIKLRTFLPETLWKSALFPDWIEEPCPNSDLCQSDYRPLLLISLDGFRADYLIRNFTPAIRRLSQCGAHAPFMRSVYPTKTFPNHYSIATGLYPESHGIIDNNMYDMDLKQRFSMSRSTSLSPKWWGGEPIWQTVQRQGLKAATYFWPGSDIKINGKRPDIWRKYDGSVTYGGRVEEVLSWMALPADQRPDFITLYFDEPDLAGHKNGPSQIEASVIFKIYQFKTDKISCKRSQIQRLCDNVTVTSWLPEILFVSNEDIENQNSLRGVLVLCSSITYTIGAALTRVDQAINELMRGLMQLKLHHCVNLVIIADHGMDDISCENIVHLGDHVDYSYLSSNFWVWDGPFGRISNLYKYKKGASGSIGATEHPEPIDRLVNNLTCASPELNTYTKSSLPVRHHYSNNQRIDNIILDMKTGWQVARNYIKYCDGGNHGYDNIDKSMEALFLAHGPAFKWNYTIEPFENIELYNLFTEILNISSSPNNGTVGSLRHILQKPKAIPNPSVHSNDYKLATQAFSEHGDFADYNKTRCNSSCVNTTQLHELYNKTNLETNQDQTSLPFGLPVMSSPIYGGKNVTVLYQGHSVTGFDVDARKVLWTSRTNPGIKVDDRKILWTSRMKRGVQLGNSAPFTDNMEMGLSSSGIFSGLDESRGLGAVMTAYSHKLADMITSYKDVNIFSGYAYDDNHDSLPDIISTNSTPSHFYTILTVCKDKDVHLANCTDFQSNTYIIPFVDGNQNCKSPHEYLIDVEARIKDVEIISGFELFSQLPFDTAIKLRTFLPQRP